MSRTSAALLLLAFTASSTQAQVAAVASTVASTCPSRSINYITHGLPQQCFMTSWASRSSSEAATAEELQTSDLPVTTPPSTPSTTQSIAKASPTPQLATLVEHVKAASTTPIPINAPSSTVEAPGKLEATPEVEQENDSPLDNANFLSFEDWKRQNLAKAGQSAENLGARAGGGEPRRRPSGIHNALDSLGEDTEIEIDFGGFVNPGSSVPTLSSARSKTDDDRSTIKDELSNPAAPAEEPASVRRRGKDAGKTCKERSNYASFDCAATVLKANPEAKGANAVLVENKDSYMLNNCAAKNKFFIVELCDDILIDTVVLANFEFFSSMFRTFRVSVSDRYPVKLEKWKEIGTFEAKNSREVQAFLVENPLIWARYLRVEFSTHFGNEYYCPVSLLRVHGTTMMEEFNHELKRSGTEEENDNEVGENEESEDVGSIPGVISAEALKMPAQQTATQVEGTLTQLPSSTSLDSVANSFPQSSAHATDTAVPLHRDSVQSKAFAPHNFSISKQIEEMLSALNDGDDNCRPQDKSPASKDPSSVPLSLPEVHKSAMSSKDVTGTRSMVSQVPGQTGHAIVPSEDRPTDNSPVQVSEKALSGQKSDLAKPTNQTSASAFKIPTSSTQPPTPNPTTQESFFKSVHKRLQLLESNSTLSLQYIEEQSRILRDAFSKVEKRQLGKTTTFLETLNTTVLTELRDFRSQYDQIWQSTVLELSSQREQSQHEVFALSARLSLLADEIVIQKRIAILQFLLILLCLGLALFSRSGSAAAYSELPPLEQNAITKSSVNSSRYAPQFETPPASPVSTRPPSRYGLFRGFTHRRSPSDPQPDRTRSRTKSPSIGYFPPTPTSQGSPPDHHDLHAKSEGGESSRDCSPEAKADKLRRTQSSPAAPRRQKGEHSNFVEQRYLSPDAGVQSQLHSD